MAYALDPNSILIRPVVTERSTDLRALNQYVFEVPVVVTKKQIADAVRSLYNKDVVAVRTQVLRGKLKRRRGGPAGRRPERKKAIVTLPQGQVLEELMGPK